VRLALVACGNNIQVVYVHTRVTVKSALKNFVKKDS
jgi:hypothetical protein